MKRFIQNINQSLVVVFLLVWTVCLGGLLIPSPAVGEESVADEIISLDATDRPLGEVLEIFSRAAVCRFNIDERWKNYPITASFHDEPLSRGLKLVFRNINHAVIYGTDRTVRVIIFDEGTPSGKAIGRSVSIKSAPESLQSSQPFHEATAPQSEVPAEESGSSEDLEEPSVAVDERGSDSDESGDEQTGTKGAVSGKAAAKMKAAALDSGQEENAPAEPDNQAEEADAASDSPQDSENTEDSADANENK
jgi:hypothetical protein